MSSLIYFDPEELKKGNYHEIDDTLVAEDGRTYVLSDWIARGGNGSVFKCIERSSGDEYAIKWTCNGFVPVTSLIMPPWLRRRAG